MFPWRRIVVFVHIIIVFVYDLVRKQHHVCTEHLVTTCHSSFPNDQRLQKLSQQFVCEN